MREGGTAAVLQVTLRISTADNLPEYNPQITPSRGVIQTHRSPHLRRHLDWFHRFAGLAFVITTQTGIPAASVT